MATWLAETACEELRSLSQQARPKTIEKTPGFRILAYEPPSIQAPARFQHGVDVDISIIFILLRESITPHSQSQRNTDGLAAPKGLYIIFNAVSQGSGEVQRGFCIKVPLSRYTRVVESGLGQTLEHEQADLHAWAHALMYVHRCN